jgi:hypothetical protein
MSQQPVPFRPGDADLDICHDLNYLGLVACNVKSKKIVPALTGRSPGSSSCGGSLDGLHKYFMRSRCDASDVSHGRMVLAAHCLLQPVVVCHLSPPVVVHRTNREITTGYSLPRPVAVCRTGLSVTAGP